MTSLQPAQLDQLRQHLIVPVAISDILHHDLAVEPDMQYGLHMSLSEIDPDSALIAIALCARDLATKMMRRAPIASALYKEADDILADYGPAWLTHNVNAPIPSYIYEEILDTVPEDLEALADLLDALNADLDEENSSESMIARLLSIQARAHMEIADFVLAEIAYERQCEEQGSSSASDEMPNFAFHTSEPTYQTHSAGDNVILFPGMQE